MRALCGACVLLALAGCATQDARPPAAAAPAPSLNGTRWLGVADGVADSAKPRLEFVAEGRVSGYSGCNMLSGGWRMENGEVRFGPMATTKRMCMGPEAQVEQRLMAVLGPGTKVRREGDRLILTAPGGASFEFTAQ